jgi:uncharacterized protein (DUF58 family)
MVTSSVTSTVFAPAQRAPSASTADSALSLAQRLPRLALEARRVAAFVNGVHGRRRPGPGETFWQYRLLMPGEASTGVDWRRSARDKRLYVREREWEASHTVWMWLDRSPSMGFRSSLAISSKVDRALVLGFALADALVDAGERVGLLGLSRPLATRAIVERLSEIMLLDQAGSDADLPPARPIGRLDEAILISDFLSPAENVLQAVAMVAAEGGRGHLVMIADPVEETFPYAGQAEIVDAHGGLKLDVGDASAWGRAYRERLKQHRDMINAPCRKLGWTMTIHRTDRPAAEAALRVAGLVGSARDMRVA